MSSRHNVVMKVLALISQKGGSTKTSLCINLAVAAGESGKRVLIIDTDEQQSATVWGKARGARTPLVATVTTGNLHRVLDAARTENINLAIVDSAPHAAPSAAIIARTSDLMVIPCRPSALDLAAAGATARIAKAAGKPAAFVLSACPPRAPEILEAQTSLITGFPDIALSPVTITDRRSFSRAIAAGMGITEFESDGKGAQEIRGLWKWIEARL
jgi:chromosome partitioning protein